MSWASEAAEAAWRVIGHGRSYPEGERRAGFNTGARWQREQLRTDEALEPWARAIYLEANAADPWAPHWDCADEFARGAAFSRARGMINTLLGEDV